MMIAKIRESLVVETLAAITFFATAGLTTLAWLGFLTWVALALLGF